MSVLFVDFEASRIRMVIVDTLSSNQIEIELLGLE